MSRFDYVKYDEQSIEMQEYFKNQCRLIEEGLSNYPDGRSKSLALTALEECYMWIGKAVRDEQTARES